MSLDHARQHAETTLRRLGEPDEVTRRLRAVLRYRKLARWLKTKLRTSTGSLTIPDSDLGYVRGLLGAPGLYIRAAMIGRHTDTMGFWARCDRGQDRRKDTFWQSQANVPRHFVRYQPMHAAMTLVAQLRALLRICQFTGKGKRRYGM